MIKIWKKKSKYVDVTFDTPKQYKARQKSKTQATKTKAKARRKSQTKTKRQLRKIWRKII